jgi:GR25 family glycosyltransferase involved in LPS biosynthesis
MSDLDSMNTMTEYKTLSSVSTQEAHKVLNAYALAKGYAEFLHEVAQTSEEFVPLDDFVNNPDRGKYSPDVKVS